jgi:hypothetical protein
VKKFIILSLLYIPVFIQGAAVDRVQPAHEQKNFVAAMIQFAHQHKNLSRDALKEKLLKNFHDRLVGLPLDQQNKFTEQALAQVFIPEKSEEKVAKAHIAAQQHSLMPTLAELPNELLEPQAQLAQWVDVFGSDFCLFYRLTFNDPENQVNSVMLNSEKTRGVIISQNYATVHIVEYKDQLRPGPCFWAIVYTRKYDTPIKDTAISKDGNHVNIWPYNPNRPYAETFFPLEDDPVQVIERLANGTWDYNEKIIKTIRPCYPIASFKSIEYKDQGNIFDTNPELRSLNFPQLRFVQDLFVAYCEADDMSPKGWIILNAAQNALFKTLPNSIQRTLKRCCQITDIESKAVIARQKRLAQKERDRIQAAVEGPEAALSLV